ncbi:MAG: hypothetical protein HP498_05660 [Nitrospira sp.]|nr:hypothetical protein [Nitrospira sp.]
MRVCAVLFILLVLGTPSQAGELEAFPDLHLNDPGAVQEATRVLEEEVKLAARAQTYLLIDLVTQTIQIKGRGIELHRIPIVSWSAKAVQSLKGVYRLITRPPVIRRKIDPTASVEQEPISLADMPVDYTLSYTPPLTIDVAPVAGENPVQWLRAHGKRWWRNAKDWSDSFSTGQSVPQSPHLQLEVSAEQAQSLAWSAVDGMALVIRRPTDK